MIQNSYVALRICDMGALCFTWSIFSMEECCKVDHLYYFSDITYKNAGKAPMERILLDLWWMGLKYFTICSKIYIHDGKNY